MKTILKKGLCCLLLLSMLLSIIPGGVMATDTDGNAGGEGSSSSISAEVADLLTQVEGLAEPAFTHNEKVSMYADGSNHHELPFNYGGTYFISNRWTDGKLYALNPVKYGNVLASEPVTTDQDLLLGVNLNMSLELIPVEVSDGSTTNALFRIKTRDNKYIHYINDQIALVDYAFKHYSSFYMYSGGLMWYDWMSDGYRYAVTMDSAAAYYYKVAKDQDILDCCKLQPYKLVTLETLKELYRQIKDAAEYLDGGAYDASIYEDFLSILRDSLSLYDTSNVYQTGKNMAALTTLSQTLKAQGDKLYDSMNRLFQSMTIEDQAARILDKVESLNLHGTYNKLVDLSGIKSNLKGKHMAMNVMWNKGFLAALYQGEYRLMDGASSSDGTVIGAIATVRNNTVDTTKENHNNQLIQFHLRLTNGNRDTSYDFKWMANGKFLGSDRTYTANPAKVAGSSDNNYQWAHSTDEERVLITDGSRCLYYNGANAADDNSVPSNAFGWANNYTSRGDQFTANFFFFRQWSTEDLYNGLQEMKNLLKTPGSYTEANYQIFLNIHLPWNRL